MLNSELIKEVCFEASSKPELMAALLNYKPTQANAGQNETLAKDYFHVIYLDLKTGPKIVYQRCSNLPLELPQIDFKMRLVQLPEINFEEVCFLLASYENWDTPSFNDKVDWSTIPDGLKKLLVPTRGYLIFEEQGAELYRLCCNNDNIAAFDWVDRIKKCNPEASNELSKMSIEKYPIGDLIHLFTDADYLKFFKRKPTYETYDILSLICENYQFIEEYETLIHLRQDGFILKEDIEEIFVEDVLLKAKLKKDSIGNFRIVFWLKNDEIHIDQEIEVGLNYEYATLNNISSLTGWYIEPSNNQFILDYSATIELPDKSAYYSISIKANFNFTLPEELKRNKMIYKLYQ